MLGNIPAVIAQLKPIIVVQYGSARMDTDLLVVLPSGAFRTLRFGQYDCLIVSQEELFLRCQWRDIALTEPVMSGRVLGGSAEVFASVQTVLATQSVPRRLIVAYCAFRARVELAVARSILSEWSCAEALSKMRHTARDVLCPIIGPIEVADVCSRLSDTLSYAVSYARSSSHYANSSSTASFRAMLESVPLLREIRDLHPSRRAGAFTDARRLVASARQFLSSEGCLNLGPDTEQLVVVP
jgi:hypothetical protein